MCLLVISHLAKFCVSSLHCYFVIHNNYCYNHAALSGAVMMLSVRVHLVNADSCTRWLSTPTPSQPIWALTPPLGSCHPHPSSPLIITQPKSWYLFYHHMEGRRLSGARHCRKGAAASACPRLRIAVAY